MKFNSVKEYFYKLNTTGYQLMMLPLIPFILHYAQSIVKLPGLILFNEQISGTLFLPVCGLGLITLTTVQIMTKKKANVIAKEVGLGIKLEKLGTLLTLKMVALSIMVLLMPLALLFSGNEYFNISFGVFVLWFFFQWPTPGRVSRLLKLRGDEREMVITRGDAFK